MLDMARIAGRADLMLSDRMLLVEAFGHLGFEQAQIGDAIRLEIGVGELALEKIGRCLGVFRSVSLGFQRDRAWQPVDGVGRGRGQPWTSFTLQVFIETARAVEHFVRDHPHELIGLVIEREI